MSDQNKGFTFIWKIMNFSMLPHQRNENILSPVFVIDQLSNVECSLDLYPRGERSKRHVACFFSIYSEVDFKAGCSFTVESVEPTAEICKAGTQHIKKGKFGFPCLISLNEIYAKKHIYLPADILTIRFNIHALNTNNFKKFALNDESPLYSNVLTKCAARSFILTRRKSITWPIQTDIPPKKSFIKVTSAFKFYPGLILSLNFDDILNNLCFPIEIRLKSLPANHQRLFVKCKIMVISGGQEYQDSKEGTHLFQSRLDDVWHFPPFLKKSKMSRGKYLYFDDILHLYCEFAFSYKNQMYDWEINYEPSTLVTRKNQEVLIKRRGEQGSEWGSCIKNLFATQTFSDVELKAGGKTYPAYKVALCARSPVFTAMFETDMKEKNSGIVEIDDIDKTTLVRMLTFLHIDELEQDLSLDEVCDLYRAADKYAIDPLKRWCSISLVSFLSVASVCDILAVADTYCDTFLMICVHDFIRSHAEEVFYSASWKSFMDSNLKLSADTMYQMLTKGL